MAKELLKGNEAIAETAVRSGLEAYFGYPITPQTELLEWLSKRMPELGRTFMQAESELAAINMVYGAACTGARVMTSSSSPGISLMMEGLSYIAGTEVPVVLIDVMRAGPGLGNIAPAQGDYNQIVHGGGHGDFRPIVLAPASIQESIDLTTKAFELADKYRTIVVVLIDGSIGQMMEPAELPPMKPVKKRKSSIYIDPVDEEQINFRLLERWNEIEANELKIKEYFMEYAELVVIGFGTAGRVALSAVHAARSEGIPVGLLRPITVSPFPYARIKELTQLACGMLVVEMNTGQMLHDVQAAVGGKIPVEFYGRMGGVVPLPDEILGEIRRLCYEPVAPSANPRISWMNRMDIAEN
jgi:2-oxoglutarate ferredoxin oxidoreductase subunit alpha